MIPKLLSCLAAMALQAGVPIEKSEPMKGGQGLGTKGYEPTAKERPFHAKVKEKKIGFWADVKIPKPENMTEEEWAKFLKKNEKPDKDVVPQDKYQLIDEAGAYVGWFGILREKTRDAKTGVTTLVLEHKYFDGATDLHLQIVSLYGGGDFTATLKQKDVDIPLLSLVRVCGKAAKDEKGAPKVTPEYVRTWDWGLFSFMDYGKDRTNAKWTALRKADLGMVYSSRPTPEYYEERLGKR